ncbi:hypothetical protein LVJ94_01280 [Pendulispora rubella]|uniref:Uncharacterized protein n=1 Tax=Pendulispora rubella TaxID=2741070 RepID=A0ABZ2L9N6_9BACT
MHRSPNEALSPFRPLEPRGAGRPFPAGAMKQTKDSAVSVDTTTNVDTDPGFPARWGERTSRGILNANGPRLDRTTPDFLSVVRDARTSKYANTLDAFPGAKAETTDPDAQPSYSANLHLRAGDTHEVVTSDLELPEVGPPGPPTFNAAISTTLPSATPVVRMRPSPARPPSTETIDELIDGLPVPVQPQRKKWERAKRHAARTPATPVAGGPFQEPAISPRRGRRGPWTMALGAALFAVLLVVAFAVVRLTKSEDVANWYQVPNNTTVALTVAIQPPPAPAASQDHVNVSHAVEPSALSNSEPARSVPRAEPSAQKVIAPAVRSADKRAPSESPAPRTAHADELESDVGNATLPKAPLPQPSSGVRDLLTGH